MTEEKWWEAYGFESKSELVQNRAKYYGYEVVGHEFYRYLLGYITKDEFMNLIPGAESAFEQAVKGPPEYYPETKRLAEEELKSFKAPYKFKVWDWATGEVHESIRGYPTPVSAMVEAKALSESNDFEREHPTPEERGFQIKVVSKEGVEVPGFDEWYKPEWMLGERYLSPRAYGDWVNLAESIKAKDPTWSTFAEVNHALVIILDEERGEAEPDAGYTADDAKRWLTEKARELGIT